jgi:hypothetical protein
MFDLLGVLKDLSSKPGYGDIRSNAGAKGGARMEAAVAAVDLQAKGGPIGAADLRGLIDKLGAVPTGQRADILRFLGKYVVINVRGLDIDFSYCKGATSAGCAGAAQDAKKWAKTMQGEYAACRGKPGVKVATDVENCVDASLAKKGITTSIAGQTSPSGTVTVTPVSMSQCQPILVRGTEIHEAVHAGRVRTLEKKFGAGTVAFEKARTEANGWIQDDINAYGAEIPFYDEVIKAIGLLEGKIK